MTSPQVAASEPIIRRALPAPASSRRVAYVQLALLALVWGVHWPVVKAGLQLMPPFTYGTLRVATSLALVVGLLAARRELRLPPRGDLGVVLLVGLGQIGAAIVLMNLALEVLPAGRSSVLVYTSPFWAALIQAAFLGVGVSPREAVGIAFGLTGIGILLNPSVIDWSDPAELAGSLALLASAAITASTVILLRYHPWRSTPFRLQPWQLLVALVPITVLAATIDAGAPVEVSPTTVLIVLYSGPLATGFAYWASQSVSRSLSPIATTMGLLAAPVIGLISSAILLGETVSTIDLVGFSVTVAGIAVVSVVGRPRTAEQRQPAA